MYLVFPFSYLMLIMILMLKKTFGVFLKMAAPTVLTPRVVSPYYSPLNMSMDLVLPTCQSL